MLPHDQKRSWLRDSLTHLVFRGIRLEQASDVALAVEHSNDFDGRLAPVNDHVRIDCKEEHRMRG